MRSMFGAIFVIVILGGLGLLVTRIVDQSVEISTLKAEKAAWQQAAMSAIRARGWEMSYTKPEDLKPENLANALNPCRTTPAGAWNNSHECDNWAMPSYGSKGVPIEIKLASK